MREIIEYLLKLEKMAGDLYRDAAVFFKADEKFADFLSLLSEDEVFHYDAMVKAGEYSGQMTEEFSAFIGLDSATKEKIEGPFAEIEEKLSGGNLTKETMTGCIVKAEFSEWNHIFLYVVNTFSEKSIEFQRLAAKIQEHKKRIEVFLESSADGRRHLGRIRQGPQLWRERVLIVEDDPVIAELLTVILSEEALVETAENGEEGLRKTNKGYYDVVLSDLNMPIMNGIEFYKQAAARDASIGRRFLFFTAYPQPENLAFFQEHNLRYLTKPANIDEIQTTVRELIHGTSRNK